MSRFYVGFEIELPLVIFEFYTETNDKNPKFEGFSYIFKRSVFSNILTTILISICTGGPLIGRNSLQDGFCLFSKFYNSSHSTAVLLSILIGLFIKKILYFLRPMRGPPVQVLEMTLPSSSTSEIMASSASFLTRSPIIDKISPTVSD